MNAPIVLNDSRHRLEALTRRDGTILVEAGAGSGKTAIIAGRIALLLSEGVAPASIAAVSFTEVSASELMSRVRDFVERLLDRDVPLELRAALPTGVEADRLRHLAAAYDRLDDMCCSTIHGFCQQLIKPYPVEADIDPGASVMDASQAGMVFAEVLEDWLRQHLERAIPNDIVTEMVAQRPAETLSLISSIANAFRTHRFVDHDVVMDPEALVTALAAEIRSLRTLLDGAGFDEPETNAIVTAIELALPALEDAGFDARGIVELLVLSPDRSLLTTSGGFRKLQKKSKWEAAAKAAGRPKTDGEAIFLEVSARYDRIVDLWGQMHAAVSSRVLSDTISTVAPVLDRYRAHKRASALLDFEDLIHSARDLLRDHPQIRDALSERHAHLLVDEFQDTDPLQAEIFWRLAAQDADHGDWSEFDLREGSLFLVGDPKQAIYRFRGADVNAYIKARAAVREKNAGGIVQITTNFRSSASVLGYVNGVFEDVLSEEAGQPGFTHLDHVHADLDANPSVVALEIACADENGKASSARKRDVEADRVAELCAALIGNRLVREKDGTARPCEPADIALLAPTSTDLWRYEEALERHGVPVSTQAGKGFFRRQEIQDLVALTRVLSNHRDTLALGALLRGPLVGLTDEELLDIVWSLPRDPARPDAIPRLVIGIDPDLVSHPVASEALRTLQSLRTDANDTTPHAILSAAVDRLHVRAILRQRHDRPERALANLDAYLESAKAYSGRGLRAFSEAMTSAWNEEERSVEAKPDAQQHAVSLVTMHASKGLEWPIVIPINTLTTDKVHDTVFVDRDTALLYAKVAGVSPHGLDDIKSRERGETDRERIRLWYVAATRARELLVMPRCDADAGSSWISMLDLGIAALPAIDIGLRSFRGTTDEPSSNGQDRDVFQEEADRIAAATTKIVIKTPSRRDEKSVLGDAEDEDIWFPDPDLPLPPNVRGSAERGLVMHKLFEEILTGETSEDSLSLAARAAELIAQLGMEDHHDAATGISSKEIAGCVSRTLRLPEIAAARQSLMPEMSVFGREQFEDAEHLTIGIADALSFDGDEVDLVVDWKSDVDPQPATIEHYKEQVGHYLRTTRARRGLIVLATSGRTIEVEPGTTLADEPA